MNYPTELLRRGRSALPSQRIRDHNFVYTRHKPSSDWNVADGLPDFTKIKLDQSFNWCIFSIPVWTRFNDERKYLAEYAVAAFSVNTIRKADYQEATAHSQVLNVQHVPLDNNYSHCELVCMQDLDKTQRRAIRMALRHRCAVPLQPDQTQTHVQITLDRLKMYLGRFISRFL